MNNLQKRRKREMLQMATKYGKQKEVTYIRNEGTEEELEVKYLLQHVGVRKGMEIQNSFFDEKKGKIDMNLKYEALMNNIIFLADTKQKTDWQYWEDQGMEEFTFVMDEASTFLSGK